MHFDAIIGGGGPTGLAVALALDHMLAGDVRLALVAPAGQEKKSTPDPRSWAISAGSRRMLAALGVWEAVIPEAEPVLTIELTDSPLEAGVRPTLLTYDNATDHGEPAAHIVPNTVLTQALAEAVGGRPAINRIEGATIEHFELEPVVTAGLSNGTHIVGDLLVAADGRASRLRETAGIDTIGWDYPQRGIVVTVRHERPHDGKAVQHFLPGGPFAMLPLRGNRTCLTWSEEAETAAQVMALDDAGFLAEAQRRFGGKLGLIELDSPRASFPLAMHLARTFISTRFALIGDAAHGVHPIAGQGLNLAFRDVAALAECISDGANVGLAFGDTTILERYERWRRFDSALSAGAFDVLNRLFSNDIALLRSAREVGLGLIDRMPMVKGLLVAEAAGTTGELPRLMQ